MKYTVYSVHCSICGYIMCKDVGSKESALFSIFDHIETKECKSSVCNIFEDKRNIYRGYRTFDGEGWDGLPVYKCLIHNIYSDDIHNNAVVQRLHKRFLLNKSIKNAGKEEIEKLVEEMLSRPIIGN